MGDEAILAQSKSAEAVNAAANAAEAVERAREAQMASAFAKALQEVFSIEDGGGRKRFIDVSRVPLICQSIVGIDKRMSAIEDSLKWVTRVVIGAVILALLALLFKTYAI